jgi:flagellar motility protein MotE (MotC chaperone)
VAAPETVAIDPTTRPTLQLDELLAKHASLTAGQQVDFVRQTFETQMAQLDRRTRELADLKAQVDLANARLASDRTALDADRKALTDEQEQARKLATDQGFQDSLKLYNSMAPRQVKAIFLTLSDDAVLQYLQAMEPRTAAKVIKEFKNPEEIDRIHRIMEQMRQGQPTTREVKE